MKLRWLMAVTLMFAGVLVLTVITDREPQRSEYCVADVDQTRAHIDLEQAQWSALMAGIAQNRGLPPRATTIAIATAFQESKIHNIDYGDRDSVGLFQQRPSQGWGTVAEIMDPHYSIGKFYDGLVKVEDYENMVITEAAQAVQRSAFPGAYAQHENYARALASALRGYSQAAFTCQINPVGGGSAKGLINNVESAYGTIKYRHVGSVVLFDFVGPKADIRARGWGLAHYLVAHAKLLKLASVSFDGKVWSAQKSDEGWRIDPQPVRNSVRVQLG